MALKQISRSGTVAFAPTSSYMAVGTMAGAIDLAFSSTPVLEVYQLDVTSSDTEMPLRGSKEVNDPFNRLTWGTLGSDTQEYSLGVIAGGLADGSVHIWNPAKMLG